MQDGAAEQKPDHDAPASSEPRGARAEEEAMRQVSEGGVPAAPNSLTLVDANGRSISGRACTPIRRHEHESR